MRENRSRLKWCWMIRIARKNPIVIDKNIVQKQTVSDELKKNSIFNFESDQSYHLNFLSIKFNTLSL